MILGDRIVVMKDGDICQGDRPQALYDRPGSKFVAGFIGSPQMNFLPVTLAAKGDEIYAAAYGMEFLILRDKPGYAKVRNYIGREVIMGIRPEHIYAGHSIPGEQDTADLTAGIDLVEPVGSEVFLFINLGPDKLCAKLPPVMDFEEGTTAHLKLDLKKIHLFDKDTELTITN